MLFIPKLIGNAGGWVDLMGYPYFSLTAFRFAALILIFGLVK